MKIFKSGSNNKGVVIFVAILSISVIFGLLGYGINRTDKEYFGSSDNQFNFSHSYVGKIFVEGKIEEGASNNIKSSSGSYDHKWTLSQIDAMMENDNNKGIFMVVNSPGGTVSASDELYLKLEEYKNKTKRPVYAYFRNMAASGGYYISADANKIIANRNCWTGSIGVTIGSLYDATELLNNIGVKSVTITSGPNKAMGNISSKLTDEQVAIFQSLVDEAYEQFLSIVSAGRNIDVETLKPIADGRIYTAKQALSAGLIDAILTESEAEALMLKSENLAGVDIESIKLEKEPSLMDILLSKSYKDTASEIFEKAAGLIEEQGRFKVTYMSPIEK
ncbi:MAG: signal peptide peptidase SppA [Peptostreptococcaceae bacterium]|nr:signal peptide peptidase SppA [Peptostreptococcaceae bacterium]MDY5739203.1 signal peptide peptidase SppA [Anaerovoracaceae bacterium]